MMAFFVSIFLHKHHGFHRKTHLTHLSQALSSHQQQEVFQTTEGFSHLFSVAPMMQYTDHHQHYLHRLLSAHTVLYTEMVGASTLTHAVDPSRYLAGYMRRVLNNERHKYVLQLGGSDVPQMSKAASIAAKFGFTEINLNCGCPSEKVAEKGCFGAVLMLNPLHVASLTQAIGDATGRPATVKCRIGVDNQDSYDQLTNFIRIVHEQGGVRHFIIHARKAILGGRLSPADNRRIPPLKPDYVYRLCQV